MKSFYEKYKENGHSQNGEWGILRECIKRIGYKSSLKANNVAVEFGGADGIYCSNTADISLTFRGWLRHLYDINPSGFGVEQKEITPENVNELPPCNILSIDIDGNDYTVWKAYTWMPDIVIIEINSSLPPMEEHFSKEKGTSYITMLLMGRIKDYFLLCHTGNMIFVRNELRNLFPEIVGDGITNYQDYFKTDWQ